jgi:multiple sugar transport system ATP-binding protein
VPALVLKDLCKSFENGAVALERLSLEVAEGELLVVLGPSGSGKSTALRLIAGLDSPTSGDIFIDGKLANKVPPRDRDIAMVFQDYALYPHFTVEQNLSFGLKMRRFSKKEIRERVKETAQMLGIGDLLNRKPKELSGGQRQRVALGRALVRRPRVFLFDEPLSNVDPTLRVQLRREIKQLHDSLQATMVYVTHDQHEAMLMGQRIAILRAGVLEQVGSPVELYRHPANKFVAGFFGTPSINFIDGEASARDGCIEVILASQKSLRLPWDSANQIPHQISVGFRPEDVMVGSAAENNGFSGNAVVTTTEAMGGETLIYLQDGAMQFCARALGFLSLNIGGKIQYCIQLASLHFFEAGSGVRIRGFGKSASPPL